MDPLSGSPLHILDAGGALACGPRARTRGRCAVRRARLHDLPGRDLCPGAPRGSESGAEVCGEAPGEQRKRGVERRAAGVTARTGCCGAELGAWMESTDVLEASRRWRARVAAVGAGERLRVGRGHLQICSRGRSFGGAAVGSGERLCVGRQHLRCSSIRRSFGGAAVGAGERLRVECYHLQSGSTRRSFGGAAVGAGERLSGVRLDRRRRQSAFLQFAE